MTSNEIFYIILGTLALVNVVTFIMYVSDKRKAVKGRWRTPEAVLLSLSFFGGGIGGYIAMYASHHKTKKWYFHLVNILGIAVLIAVISLSYMMLF